MKRREVKSKGEKQRYTHLNAEFQTTARRDKRAFLSDECKETEENNRMRRTRDLFKKIRDTKETFHAKIGPIKDRNGMDLTEAEDIKKRWQEYTETLYKKNIHDPHNHNGVITYLEPAAADSGTRSCPTLCDSIDGSPPGSPVPGILQGRTLEWVAISFSNA